MTKKDPQLLRARERRRATSTFNKMEALLRLVRLQLQFNDTFSAAELDEYNRRIEHQTIETTNVIEDIVTTAFKRWED